METYERIKLLRKDILDMTQEEFSSKIKISRANIGSIETGRISVTDRVIFDICHAFNVRGEWLRSGEGEMFQSEKSFSLDEYVHAHNFTDIELRILKTYLEIPVDLREKVLGYVSHAFSHDSEIDRQVQSYLEELEAEKKVEAGSLASPDTKEA